MTEENSLNNDAPQELAANTKNGEFDGLDIANGYGTAPPKRRNRLPLLFLILLLVGGSMAAVWQVFLGGDLSGDGVVMPPQAHPEVHPEIVAEAPPPVETPIETPAATTTVVADALTPPPPPLPPIKKPEIIDDTLMAPPPPPEVKPTNSINKDALIVAPKTLATIDAPVAVKPPVPPLDQKLSQEALAAQAFGDNAAPKNVGAKTAATIQAVNDILGQDAVLTPAMQRAQEKNMLAPAEVTPRAKQVIFVRKAYSKSSPQAMQAAGDRVLDAGQFNDAAVMYDRQLKGNPSDPLALAGKAMALQRAGRTEEALRTYDRLLSLNPRDIDALTNYLGLLQLQNPRQALSRLNTLAEQYPDNAAIAGQRGMVQAKLMDTPNALRSFQKAMALDNSNPIYAYNMAVLYDRLGNGDKARVIYRQALDIANAYPERGRNVPLDQIRGRLQTMGN